MPSLTAKVRSRVGPAVALAQRERADDGAATIRSSRLGELEHAVGGACRAPRR